MYEIVRKKVLNEQVVLNEIQADRIAKKCKAGQFIILRVNEEGERIPLTVADYDREKGTVTIIYQIVGKSTMMLSQMEVGDCLSDFVGPLGIASHTDGMKKVAIIGGGLGCAIAYPQAKAFFKAGCEVDMVAGFRNKDLVILEAEMKAASTNLYVMTDDGSNGNQGFVTDQLKKLLDAGNEYDCVIAIGPLMMMKFVCKLTKEYNVKTIVSMNPVMIDGTGMCGGCRLTVGGETKFACVDGPDFDGHEVDFDEAIRRSAMYKKQEVNEAEHYCNMMKQADSLSK